MEQEKEKSLETADILQLMEQFERSSLQSFSYQRGEEKLKMRKAEAVCGKPEKMSPGHTVEVGSVEEKKDVEEEKIPAAAGSRRRDTYQQPSGRGHRPRA